MMSIVESGMEVHTLANTTSKKNDSHDAKRTMHHHLTHVAWFLDVSTMDGFGDTDSTLSFQKLLFKLG
jgi:diphthamide synthase (EF-2-diphthine--ammonia ligase)